LTCVCYYSTGFGWLDEMIESSIIDNINASNADFLVVALGAKKGQAWIVKNLYKIKTPLVSHLGAVINFEARRLKRAPVRLQKIGLEWAWRIKEEPHLWKRYWDDGKFLLRFLATKILPHAVWLKFNRKRLVKLTQKSSVVMENGGDLTKLIFSGVVLDPVSEDIRSQFRGASKQNKNVLLDLSNTEYLGCGVLGLLLILKKQLYRQGFQMKVVGQSANMRKFLDWNGLTFLTE